MPLTPETLARHELVGLEVAVVAAANPDLVGIRGEVAMETMQTLTVTSDRVQEWQVPKDGTTFEFRLPDGQRVTVEGSRLVARPARRTEQTGDSTWR